MADRHNRQWWRVFQVALALCGFLGGLGASGSASAGHHAGRASARHASPSTGGGDDADDHDTLGYVLIGAACVLAAGLAGGYLYVRRRRRDQMRLDFQGFRPAGPAGRGTQRRVEMLRGPSEAGSTSAGVSADVVGGEVARTVIDVAPHEQGNGQRQCPNCSRTFSSAVAVCPHDATALRPLGDQRHTDQPAQLAGHGLDRMVCTGCERRFEMGADYCSHDGLPLMQDTREYALHAPRFTVCKSCGWDTHDHVGACPNDACSSHDEALVDIDPADATDVRPTIPMTICPTCRQYGRPGQARCPEHGDVLTPLVDMRTTAFPARGFGPRRKICGECGTEYGGGASYCTHDGAPLVTLN